ncbi:MAG: hypothetical protein ABI995_10545 [Acidobacteriota bacterium]
MKRILLATLLGCLCAEVLAAAGFGRVGEPYIYNFKDDFAEFNGPWYVTLKAGTLPPGLTLKTTGELSGVPTAAAVYPLTLNYASASTPNVVQFFVTFNVTVLQPTGLPVFVKAAGLTFSVAVGGSLTSQVLHITNPTGVPQTLNITQSLPVGETWLAVSPASATLPAFGDVAAVVSVGPARLLAGVYTGSISVALSPSGQVLKIPVVMTVSGAARSMTVSQTGLTFQTVEGPVSPPAQKLRVFSSGTTQLAFTPVITSKRTGSRDPVSVLTTTIDPGTSGTVEVVFNTAGAPVGAYYYLLTITAQGIDPPQLVTIVVNVQPANTPVVPSLQPTGLVFLYDAVTNKPIAQTVKVNYASATPIHFTAVEYGTPYLDITTNGIASANQPGTITVIPKANLPAGIYLEDVFVSFTETKTTKSFNVVTVKATPDLVIGAAGATAVCTPSALYPVFTQLGSGFTAPVGWPASIVVTVVDNCGNPLLNGGVEAAFSNGDPPLSLLSGRDGTWSATWEPRTIRTQVAITLRAQQFAPAISGTQILGGQAQANVAVPIVDANGVVSAASNGLLQPLAPGSFISIYGSNLSNGLTEATTNPYGTTLGNTQVFLGPRELPLKFVFNTQVNAIIPYDVPINSTQQLLVVNGTSLSLPEKVVITAAQPALFTKNQGGTGEGIIVGIKADGSRGYIISPSDRVTGGDYLVIYVAGLGAVTPPVAPGLAAPNSPLSWTDNPVTVTIGGVDARVDFSGLAPGFPGVYQVNALVPAGIPPGVEVPLIVTSAGKSSTVVTISIQ